jgi:hypothetical protein
MELAVGAEEWDELVSVAKKYVYSLQSQVRTQADDPTHSLELEFILPENILQAIAYVDMFYVDSAAKTRGRAVEEIATGVYRENCRRHLLARVSPSSEGEDDEAAPARDKGSAT